jgi:Protein of unknown function (DUF3105)
MSMSTSGVPRPAVNKIAAKKAVAAGSPEPDEDVVETDAGGTDKAPVKAASAGGTAGTGTGTSAATGSGAAKTTPTKTTPTKTAPSKAATKTTPTRVTTGKAGATASPAKATPAKAGARPGGRGPAGRRPVKAGGGRGGVPRGPIRVSQGTNWGPILMFGGAAVLALLIVGFGAYVLLSRPDPTKWKERAEAIPGIVNYNKTHPEWLQQQHKNGVLSYPMSPPAGGPHNPTWQNCMGNVYPAEIPKEQATHSLEHGAVWIAYKPGLPKDQIDKLAAKVDGRSFMLMSPYPGLDAPISLQAWGYQLKVQNADDSRIDDFIDNLRQNATKEPQAGCSGGITDTGTTPLDLTPAS